MPSPTNCIPFDRARAGRTERAKRHQPVRRTTPRVEHLIGIYEHLSPAQYAFLSGVLAILAAHGEEALTRSCEMVIERFGRGRAG